MRFMLKLWEPFRAEAFARAVFLWGYFIKGSFIWFLIRRRVCFLKKINSLRTNFENSPGDFSFLGWKIPCASGESYLPGVFGKVFDRGKKDFYLLKKGRIG